jgi:hypothetical protein
MNHVAFYDAVEGRPVEVALPREEDEVVDGLGGLLGEEPDPNGALLCNEAGVVVLVGGSRAISGGLP